MNCDQFVEQMNQLLDARDALESDRQLSEHARSCEQCNQRMKTWQGVAHLFPLVEQSPVEPAVAPLPANHPRLDGPLMGGNADRTFKGRAIAAAMAGLAAAILLVVVPRDSTPPNSPMTPPAGQGEPNALAQANTDLDPATWWRDVQNRDWVDQTMPTVRNVQESVAPIGRSLMRAVTILTTGVGDRTS